MKKKEYAEKFYYLENLKEINIQEYGNYWDVPAEYLTEEGKKNFGIGLTEDIWVQLSNEEIYLQNYVKKDYLKNIDCNFDEELHNEFINGLMNNTYKNYLVVLFNSTWNNLSGIKLCDEYIDCFYRDYDCTMRYDFSSPKGKILSLRESSHDSPLGYRSIIIGLTAKEAERINNISVDEIIKFAKKYIQGGVLNGK